MDEELKKNLEEIKKEVEEPYSQEEKRVESQDQKEVGSEELKPEEQSVKQPEENLLSPEKVSGLVEELVEKPEEPYSQETTVEQSDKTKRFSLLKNIWFWGILGSIVFLLAGVYLIYKILFFQKPQEPLKTELSSEKTEPSFSKETPVNATETSKVAKIIISKIEQKENYYPYKFEIKELLIPVENKNYLNVDLVFYFDNSTTMKEIVNQETAYREFIYERLQKVPISVWFDLNKKKELEEGLKEEMKKKGLLPVPQKIEIEGVVFRG